MPRAEVTARLSQDLFDQAVAAADRAPSMFNSHPWRFYHNETQDTVEVRGDRSRTPPIADPTGWAMRLAVGAATYNLRLALTVQARPYGVAWLPSNAQPDLLAVLAPTEQPAPHGSASDQERLYRAIELRHSTRAPLRPQAVPATARAEILRAARSDDAWGELVIGLPAVSAVAEITRAAQRILDETPEYAAEQRTWTGHCADTQEPVTDLPPSRAVWESTDPLAAGVDPIVVVLGTTGDFPIDHLRAGYALQRLLLTITDLGLAYQLYSQPIEVSAAREQLRLALGRHGTPQMVLRVGYGEDSPSMPGPAGSDVVDD
jgi:nitroreductase